LNVSEFLAITSAIVPDREAVLFEDKRITYAELAERANRLANALADMGVGTGDRVAAIQVNCNEHVEASFATARLDGIYVPLNFRARADELVYMLNDAGPKVILVGKRYFDTVQSIRSRLTSIEHIIALEEPFANWHFYDELLTGASEEEPSPNADDDDTIVLMFTAGTTGFPKGVMLTHNSFSSYILNNVEPPDLEVAEKNILTVPLYHIAGLQAVMASVYGGRTLVVQRQFEPKEWMELVQRERVDRAMMVPTMLKQLMDHKEFQDYDLSSLQVITYGAAPMPLEVIRRALVTFPKCRFINAFGQTETASTITMLPPEDHVIPAGLSPEEEARRIKRLSSIGRPLSDVEVRVVDENGNDVPTGEVGEVVARGPRLMKGYWKQDEATSQTMRGGWLYTGDLGYMDEEQYIYLSGRAKDFIKRGGEMISPLEVEQTLMSHPDVDDAAIIGVPDLDWGERVRAVVVLKPKVSVTEDELSQFCRERMASYKRPESVVFVDELPRNHMGKVLKRVLRDRYNQPIG
jgi:acyl-CoA synthetase (AMP-forming)/AMP-acid ligase II